MSRETLTVSTPTVLRTKLRTEAVAQRVDTEPSVEGVLAWVRALPGTQRLRALVVFDEVYGYLPAHPHNPPTKGPLVALMKQARAFGVDAQTTGKVTATRQLTNGHKAAQLAPAASSEGER